KITFVELFAALKTRGPLLDRGSHFNGISFCEHAPCLTARPSFVRGELIEKFAGGCSDKAWFGDQGPPFCGDSPDSAMLLVAARVAKAGLIVADDRIIPIGHINRAVGANLHIDGAKTDVARNQQRRLFFGGKAGAVVFEPEDDNPIIDESARN